MIDFTSDLIKEMKIGIAGSGGLGSNIARFLILAGFTNIKLADFDRVEESNLNRQFFFYDQIGVSKVEALRANLLRINPDAKIEAVNLYLNKENMVSFFDDCHLAVEAFDKKECKQLLVEQMFGKIPVVAASGIAGGDCSSIRIKKSAPGLTVVGDFYSDAGEKPLAGYKVSMVSSLMTEEIINELCRIKSESEGVKDE